MNRNSRKKWFAPVATLLSLITCYGTLAAVALLGTLGVGIALNETIWAGAIVLFAGLAFLALLLQWRSHNHAWPVVIGGIGFLVICFTMLVAYNIMTEIAGFILLCAGAVIDWRIGRDHVEMDA